MRHGAGVKNRECFHPRGACPACRGGAEPGGLSAGAGPGQNGSARPAALSAVPSRILPRTIFAMLDVNRSDVSTPSTSSGIRPWQRRPPRPADRQLHREATEWVLQLPLELRPASTCARYPRIVNRIVDAWLRTDQCRQLFDHLLTDRRAGRRGFPLSVREELRALAAHRLDGWLPAAGGR